MGSKDRQDLDTRKKREDLLPELTEKQYSDLTLMGLHAGLHNAKELIQSIIGDRLAGREMAVMKSILLLSGMKERMR